MTKLKNILKAEVKEPDQFSSTAEFSFDLGIKKVFDIECVVDREELIGIMMDTCNERADRSDLCWVNQISEISYRGLAQAITTAIESGSVISLKGDER